MPSPPTWRLLNGATTIKQILSDVINSCVLTFIQILSFSWTDVWKWFCGFIKSFPQHNYSSSIWTPHNYSNRNIDNQHTLILILKNHVLTSSPSSYGLRIPWTPLCLPCSPCTGRTAHAHTHAHTHTRTQARTHARTHTPTHTLFWWNN